MRILDAIPDLLFEVSAEGEYLYVHTPEGHPYSPFTHGPPGGIVGRNMIDILPKDGVDTAMEAIRKTLATGRAVQSRWSRPFPDGETRHYDARSVPTERGTVVVLVRDVTEYHKTLRELERSNEDLQQFAYVASHDLIEPIRGMIGSADVVLDELGPRLSEEDRVWLCRIKENATRMQHMVRDLLQFSRAGTNAVHRVWLDAAEEVHGILEDFRTKIAETGADVRVQSIPWVFYDRTMFRVVIGNLLSNALKFGRPGSAPKIEISGHGTVGGMVTIVVRDNGIGIPRDKHRVIFEPGRRLHHRDVYPGSGLGLASVARIVKRCGGDLSLRSYLGEGTEFFFTVPGGVPNVDSTPNPDR